MHVPLSTNSERGLEEVSTYSYIQYQEQLYNQYVEGFVKGLVLAGITELKDVGQKVMQEFDVTELEAERMARRAEPFCQD